MGCKHEQERLIGTADGIVCSACGKLFKSFAEIHGDYDVPPAEKKPTEAKKTAKNNRKKKGEA